MSTRKTESECVYDVKSKKWVKKTYTSTTKGKTPSKKAKSNSTKSSTSNKTSSDKTKSQASADKEYIEVEFTTLEGDLSLRVTSESLKIKAGDTLILNGVGKYLSGHYYVASVHRTLDSSGYSHSFTLFKNGFGEDLKDKKDIDTKYLSSTATRPAKKVLKVTKVTTGDRVKFNATKALYAGSKNDGRIIPAFLLKKTYTVTQISKNGAKCYLKELFTWTYTKYLKKA